MKRITIILVIFGIFIISARGQGFLNLNFELAYNLPGNPGDGESVSVANALPDWTAYDDALALSSMYYVSNYISGSQSAVELEGGTLALSGNDLTVELFMNSAIDQTGVVPDNAESLEFEAGGVAAGGSFAASGFSVTLGGDTLSLSAISKAPDYTVYGANIPSDLDGLSEELIFLCQSVGSGQVLLDDIEFLPTSVPEPSEYVLIGVGGILLGIRYWRKLGK